ncbi:DUF6880 family protein [Ochrobactrum sp. Marseille-Q0166]|uniref:DUF6880 family protein n=1 Tax=Ochrobactrum sp. Marseille-Q0166 TaxID=2761105 RepID=UPI0032B51AAF
MANHARISSDRLVEKIFSVVQYNVYGQYDPLIISIAPVSGEPGLQKLQNAIQRSISDNWDQNYSYGKLGSGPIDFS